MCCLSSAELSKHKRYEIRMSVYNAVGEGPSSPPQEVFVGEAGMHASCLCGEGGRLYKLVCGYDQGSQLRRFLSSQGKAITAA